MNVIGEEGMSVHFSLSLNINLLFSLKYQKWLVRKEKKK